MKQVKTSDLMLFALGWVGSIFGFLIIIASVPFLFNSSTALKGSLRGSFGLLIAANSLPVFLIPYVRSQSKLKIRPISLLVMVIGAVGTIFGLLIIFPTLSTFKFSNLVKISGFHHMVGILYLVDFIPVLTAGAMTYCTHTEADYIRRNIHECKCDRR